MTVTRIDIIDRSVEKAHIWINDLAEELGTGDRHYAYRVLRAFLHALRDHLTVKDAIWIKNRHARYIDVTIQRFA